MYQILFVSQLISLWLISLTENPLASGWTKWAIQLFTECLLQNPDWYSKNILCFTRRSMSWLCTTLPLILDITDSNETSL